MSNQSPTDTALKGHCQKPWHRRGFIPGKRGSLSGPHQFQRIEWLLWENVSLSIEQRGSLDTKTRGARYNQANLFITALFASRGVRASEAAFA